MPTTIFNKEQFIKWATDNIKDDQAIIISNDLDGRVDVMKKRPIKRMPFAFNKNVFEQTDSIGDIMNMSAVGVLIAEQKDLSKQAQVIYNAEND